MSIASLPDGGYLAYLDRGAGVPLLLLRPVGGSMAAWARFADVLAEQVRVIVFDPRGAAGGSSAAPWLTTTRSMARDAKALLDHLGLPCVHVYGISLGGMVASWLCVDAPERVARLTLASTLPMGVEVRKQALDRGISIAKCMLRSPRETEACMAVRILSREFRARQPDEVERIQARARSQPATHRGLLTLLAAAARHDVRAQLPKIAAATLVLVGAHDPFLTLQSQRELLGRIPDARFDVIAGAGHDVSAEAPDATATRVLAHLRD